MESVLCFMQFFYFIGSYLLSIDFYSWTIGVLFRKSPPVSMNSNLFFTFSSIGLSVFRFMLKSLVFLDSTFVQSDKHEFVYIILYTCSQFEQNNFWKCYRYIFMALIFYQKLDVPMQVDSCQVFNSIDQRVCFYANAMQCY